MSQPPFSVTLFGAPKSAPSVLTLRAKAWLNEGRYARISDAHKIHVKHKVTYLSPHSCSTLYPEAGAVRLAPPRFAQCVSVLRKWQCLPRSCPQKPTLALFTQLRIGAGYVLAGTWSLGSTFALSALAVAVLTPLASLVSTGRQL